MDMFKSVWNGQFKVLKLQKFENFRGSAKDPGLVTDCIGKSLKSWTQILILSNFFAIGWSEIVILTNFFRNPIKGTGGGV
jgi:hypothetical protein